MLCSAPRAPSFTRLFSLPASASTSSFGLDVGRCALVAGRATFLGGGYEEVCYELADRPASPVGRAMPGWTGRAPLGLSCWDHLAR
ncbi:hypothetical protein DL93DRAFT_2091302 [Clavulina sp. PMI_390]|nr:hypothetical protein DL93DRAFT_2091302 [Clavulina sp. PMI_390]